MHASRIFPRPWRVEVTEGRHFVHARKNEALRSNYMTHAEAVVIAEAIARLPDL
jgi:hypothetical protein